MIMDDHFWLEANPPFSFRSQRSTWCGGSPILELTDWKCGQESPVWPETGSRPDQSMAQLYIHAPPHLWSNLYGPLSLLHPMIHSSTLLVVLTTFKPSGRSLLATPRWRLRPKRGRAVEATQQSTRGYQACRVSWHYYKKAFVTWRLLSL